jgi:hypothetical protein
LNGSGIDDRAARLHVLDGRFAHFEERNDVHLTRWRHNNESNDGAHKKAAEKHEKSSFRDSADHPLAHL